MDHSRSDYAHEVFALDNDKLNSRNDNKESQKTFDHLDDCINEAYSNENNYLTTQSLSERPKKRSKTEEDRPIAYVRFNTRRGKPQPVTIKALLDSGASSTLISHEYAKKLKLRQKTSKAQWTTPAGTFKTTGSARGQFILPELHDNRMIEWDMHVAPSLGTYDMIIGRDVLEDLGIDIRFSSKTIEWDGADMPFKSIDVGIREAYHIPDPDGVQEDSDHRRVLDNDYERADLDQVAEMQTHLSPEEQEKLKALLHKYEPLFDGTLGAWTHDDYHLELKPDVKPYHARAFPVPRVHYETLKKEVQRLCDVGVLKRVNRSEWAAPTFIIPKKDGKARFVSDFRELNKRIKRVPYPVPNIQDMMLNLERFQYATALDLNMGYYHVRLDADSRKLCTIVLPFGKFEYQRLPQGICNGPDIFQEKMMELFDGMEYIRACIDDLLVLTKGDYDDHLEKLDRTLSRLTEAGLKVNARKSYFARGELEYLGYWITREGIKPLPKKIEAIQRISPPTNKKELRRFIGIVNYYRDMWIRRSHCLAPLAALTSKAAKWKWGPLEAKSFEEIKRAMSREVMLAYPDFSKPFEIHTDASAFQLGAVISQDGKPIAFYSRKLNDAQTRYTTTERELLSIVETLKEFKNILLGHRVIVHTDHKNLVCKHFNTDRVMRWRLVLEEFGPELRYIKGEHNVVADALSRLDMMSFDEYEATYTKWYQAECFADIQPEEFPKEFPCSYAQIQYEQDKDASLLDAFAKSELYKRETYLHSNKEYKLITRSGKIVLPKALQKKTAEWCHNILMHPGETRTELTIGQHFYWPKMRQTIKHVCSRCMSCQLTKKKLHRHGLLPPKDPQVIPWHTVCVDLIGPYTIGKPGRTVKGKYIPSSDETTLHCLTMIDPATGWFEIVEVEEARADVTSVAFQETWLNRYPRPTEVVLDRGREFKAEFHTMLRDEYGITRKPITTRNPQANSMVERAHQTMHNMIRSQRIRSKHDLPNGSWTGILSAIGFAMRSTVHTTNQASPCQLVFGRDAMLNVNFEANWQCIKARKQKLIVQNNKRENAKRVPHTYNNGDRVIILQNPNRKHGSDLCQGPWTIAAVNDNGTARLTRNTPAGGVVTQTWNIRNVAPYRD